MQGAYSNENITTAASISNKVISNFVISEKASNRSSHKVPSVEMGSSYHGKTIQTFKKPSRKRTVPKKKKKHSAKPCVKNDNSYFRDTVSILICLLKTINSIFSQKLPWILFILMATKSSVHHKF